jgi:hypothetical protein
LDLKRKVRWRSFRQPGESLFLVPEESLSFLHDHCLYPEQETAMQW